MEGSELLNLRTKHKVTQESLAEYLGYFSQGVPNRSMIARMEKGYQKINFRHKVLIENYFKGLEDLQNANS